MKRFIIIVSVYDQENTQAYPLGGIFDTHAAAKAYMLDHLAEVRECHWTKDREDGIDDYFEEVNMTGFEARDNATGQSLEIEIREVPDMTGKFPVAFVTRQNLDDAGYDLRSILDDDIESIANRMGKYYYEGYCNSFDEDLKSAADYLGTKEKED